MKNIIVDDCHLLGSLFLGGGGEFGRTSDQEAYFYFDLIFHPFLPTSSRVLSYNSVKR